ncbi:M15 family metallopeptidase [Clostridiaceae bacterium OttesenSCG-928-D20]|nr:M15 family metallopeptidase [Clostridiaceae bacterium OttesenSCG-928-D20]
MKIFKHLANLLILTILVLGIAVMALGIGVIEQPIQNIEDEPVVLSDQIPQNNELPEIDLSDWSMILINPWNAVPANYELNLDYTLSGYMLDKRIIESFEKMMEDGIGEGMNLVLTSAYRTNSYQKELFDNKIQEVMAQKNCSFQEAAIEAATVVANPGTSEHEIGLAVDIVSGNYNIMDEGYAETAEAKWLNENCAKYGFIVRYGRDKQPITGVIYEPWHFRYVGEKAAQYIMENNICLEEFLDLYK